MSDWERITALFGAARLLDSQVRSTFLDAACGEDGRLRGEVERLLEDSAKEDSFLAAPWAETSSPEASTLTLPPGYIVNNRYRVEASVGSGGQAIVYRATDTVLSRPVILKVMRAARGESRLLKSRFESEMKALSRIDHPGVVGILDVGELADGCAFLVIQYVNGVSLREEMRKGPIEPQRAARLVRELGSALNTAHSFGVAHRDVKPENIMVQCHGDGTESPKLIDFGISKIERLGIERGVTSVMVAGTIRYMAPEQFEGKHSAASDVYSLALVACEMLCGYPDSRAVPRELGSKTRELLDSATMFRAEDRPADIRKWSAQLADAIGSSSRPRRQNRWRAGLATVAAALAGVLAAGLFWHSASSADGLRIPGLSSDSAPTGVDSRRASGKAAASTIAATPDLSGHWTVTGILVVCGFMCGSPVGTVLHSTAVFVQDTPTTFHGTYFDIPIQGTVSGNSISLGFDNLHVPAMARRGSCTGTFAGAAMTLNCSEYLKPRSASEFMLNGTRTDTVEKQ